MHAFYGSTMVNGGYLLLSNRKAKGTICRPHSYDLKPNQPRIHKPNVHIHDRLKNALFNSICVHKVKSGKGASVYIWSLNRNANQFE